MRPVLLIMIALLFTMTIDAQKRTRMSGEQLEAQKIAFITTKLDLTTDEAIMFWPVYNEYSKKLDEIRRKNRTRINIEDLTEENAEAYIMESIASAESELNLKKEHILKLKSIISMKKIAQLSLLERAFKKQMLMKIKEKRNYKREKSKN